MPMPRGMRIPGAGAGLLALLLSMLLAGPPVLAGTTAAPEEANLLEVGRHALESRCSRCHAIDKTGASPHAEAPPFRDVVKRYPPENLEESLAEGISSGHPDMPEYVLAPEEIAGVVRYLNTLAGP
jgi:cytochrome c